MSNYSKLDRPEVVSHLFFPLQLGRTPLSENCCDFDCTVEENIVLGCRFHAADKSAPTIIFFHGNGETVADYDQIGAKYVQFGMNFLVTTYRGYGWSTGTPTVTSMLADTDIIMQKAQAWLEEKGFSGVIFVMGRSLGSAPAIDLVQRHQDVVKGLIIESGFSDTLPLTKTLGIDAEHYGITEEDCFRNSEKIAEIKITTLILHGARDTTIPIQLAEKLQACSGARAKQFIMVPGADHNTLIDVGGDRYFDVIKTFVDKACGITKWQYKRRKYTRPTSK